MSKFPFFDNIRRATPEEVQRKMFSADMKPHIVHGPFPGAKFLFKFEFNKLFDWTRKPIFPPKPDPTKIIYTADELNSLLPRPSSPWTLPHDEDYEIWRENELTLMQAVIIAAGVSDRRFIPKRRDCDNFTANAKAAVNMDDRTVNKCMFDSWWTWMEHGEIVGHSVSEFPVLIDGEVKQRLRENQTDTIFIWPKNWTFWRREG